MRPHPQMKKRCGFSITRRRTRRHRSPPHCCPTAPPIFAANQGLCRRPPQLARCGESVLAAFSPRITLFDSSADIILHSFEFYYSQLISLASDLAQLFRKHVAVRHDEPLGIAQQQRITRHSNSAQEGRDPRASHRSPKLPAPTRHRKLQCHASEKNQQNQESTCAIGGSLR